MNRSLWAALLLSLCVAAGAQAQYESPFGSDELLNKETRVLILNDGEQIVIRGDYTVKGELVYFYADHGRYPAYACIALESVNLDATESANEELVRNRERRRNFYQLIEERRKRLLTRERTPVTIVNLDGNEMRVTDLQANPTSLGDQSATIGERFAPYSELDVVDRSEAWWRAEARRLFNALDESNRRLRQINSQLNDRIVERNRARTAAEALRFDERINELERQKSLESSRANIIGMRLAELSEYAEQQNVPLQWLIPDGSIVYDTGTRSEQAQPDNGEADALSYSAEELRNVSDGWWQRELGRLRGQEESARAALRTEQQRYNDLIQQRSSATSEGELMQINQRLNRVEQQISLRQRELDRIQNQIQELVEAARQLGKAQALGLMTGDEQE